MVTTGAVFGFTVRVIASAARRPVLSVTDAVIVQSRCSGAQVKVRVRSGGLGLVGWRAVGRAAAMAGWIAGIP